MTGRAELRPQSSFDWTAADAFLFDIDGTLLNVRDAVHYFAFSSAVRAVFGLELTIDGVPLHGNTDLGILRAALRRAGVAEADFVERLPALLERLADEVERNHAGIIAEICPAILELVQELTRRGKLLGVASGNIERVGWLKVQKAGLREYFQLGAFSNHFEGRADIFRHALAQVHERIGPSAQVCVIGDTPADIAAARQIGLPVIAVATGTFSFEQLEAEDPDLCLPCCDPLLARFRQPTASGTLP